jgi:alkaline phosphatase D
MNYILLCCIVLSSLVVQAQNLLPDPNNKPFYHGVASGDPLPDKVILWTRITPDEPDSPPLNVRWEVASDRYFVNIVKSGAFLTSADRDFTVKVDVDGLSPYSNYYFRFIAPDGTVSMMGRTKTAPSGDVDNLRMVVVSCSSLFSGYFNAYRKIAERRDLDAVIHLGDYIYEFIDEDEEIRVPEPYLQRPQNLEDWRWIHRYYHLDPDMRAAKQQHPFIILWDNHDISSRGRNDFQPSIKAFYEWTPVRERPGVPEDRLYRKLSYGSLLDIYLLDIQHLREVPQGVEDFNDPRRKILGDEQMNWFLNDIAQSNAQWRIIGSQKQFGQWSLLGVPGDLGLPLYGGRAWDGFVSDRNKVLKQLRDFGKNNNIFISGDNHMTFLMDIIENPFDPQQYNPNGSANSIGVEFQPASVSRGNFDETLRGIIPVSGIRQIENASKAFNRHHVFVDFVDHGYGLLDIRKERAVGEVYNIPILEVTEEEWLDVALETRDRSNRWRRAFIREPSVPISPSGELAPFEGDTLPALVTSISIKHRHLNAKIFPNPAKEEIKIMATLPGAGQVIMELYDIDGRLLKVREAWADDTNFAYSFSLLEFADVQRAVLLRVVSQGREYTARVIISP